MLMGPIAAGKDMLQGQEKAYMRLLLPTRSFTVSDQKHKPIARFVAIH